jgi:CRP-like cAMP-binding protein
LRSFGLDEGREVNIKFFFEDEFASDFESLRYQTPSQFFMVAMEDVTVFYTTKIEATPVLKNYLRFLFRFFQDQYLKETEHSNSFKLMSPEERYVYLLENKPYYLQRIPVSHLATYLGMSRETLTRIRKKIM